MAVKMSKSTEVTTVSNTPKTEAELVTVTGNTSVQNIRQEYSLVNVREQYKNEIMASGEVDKLTSLIDIGNTNSILEFGKEPAMEMAKVADKVMSKYDGAALKETTQLVDSLMAVMKKVDIGEIEDVQGLLDSNRKKKSFFDKFKESAEDKLNKLVSKYKTLGSDMDKICTQLTVYEQQIKESNKDIARMYDQAKVNYRSLTAYILAGEQAIKEIEEYRDNRKADFERTGDSNIQFEVQEINNALELMEQRVADLRVSETLALQSVPVFKIQEMTNANLARKINSAFVTTVPAFKNALVNSVIAKQQALQIQGLQALDEATSMLVRKNAENAVVQMQRSQKLASSSAVKADDIEYAWNTIMDGIKQYHEMEIQYKQIRADEARRIEEVNAKYMQSIADGSSL